MSVQQQHTNTFLSQGVEMLKAMVGIAVVCAFFIALTYESTYARIVSNKAKALDRAVLFVLPGIKDKESYYYDGSGFMPLQSSEEEQVQSFHAGFDDNGKLKAIAIEAAGMGFADVIKILFAYDPFAEEVTGFKVLESKETPGLGDKIEKDEAFLKNFEHLDAKLSSDRSGLAHQIRTVKQGKKQKDFEIDGITGATISSVAIGDIINESGSRWIPIIKEKLGDFKFKAEEIDE